MDILTLLIANIKKKKGTFISVTFLMLIISAVITSLISVRDNYQTAMKAALKSNRGCDVRLSFPPSELTDDIRAALENSELVGSVRYSDALYPQSLKKDSGDDGDYNMDHLRAADADTRFFKDDLSGLESEPRTVQDGEIYIPLGHKSLYKCEIGDKFTASFGDKTYSFTLKGYTEEPMCGSAVVDSTFTSISPGNFERISQEQGEDTRVMVYVDKADGCGLSSARFARELAKELKEKAGFIARSAFSSDSAYKYAVLLPDLLINMALVFAAFLFVIVLIVMSHSIGAEIDTDYVTIGILKSQGFTGGKIRALFIYRYLLAQSAGIIVGCIATIPIERAVSRICMMNTGIFPSKNISVGKAALFMAAILAVCTVLILIRTRRAAKISPVRAISNGKEEIYFASRLQAPISKKALSASLAFRQITSGAGRYVGVVFIVGILSFFMISVNLIGTLLSSKEALAAMGIYPPDLQIMAFRQDIPEDEAEAALNEAEKLVDEYAGISNKIYFNPQHLFYDGDSVFFMIYKYRDQPGVILKGRAPRYDNEVVLTELTAEAYDLNVGDKIRLAYNDNEEEYLITGLFQSSQNAGMVFAMSFEAADRIGVPHNELWLDYMFDDVSKLDEIKSRLDGKYSDVLETVVYHSIDEAGGMSYTAIVTALQIFIYVFSTIFVFVVVRMVVSKAFSRERTDIGVYKAIGFTSNKLRLGFAARFTITALVGAALGAVLSAFAAEPVLTLAFRAVGFTKLYCDFTTLTIALPIVFMGIAFFVFSFLVSGKVKRVAVRELVVE